MNKQKNKGTREIPLLVSLQERITGTLTVAKDSQEYYSYLDGGLKEHI